MLSGFFSWGCRDVYKALSDDDVVTRKLVIQREERVSPVFIPDVPGLVPERGLYDLLFFVFLKS